MGLKTECDPVWNIGTTDQVVTIITDSSKRVKLTIIDEAEGKVSCPLLKNGLCNGKFPCHTNINDMYTTVVEQ